MVPRYLLAPAFALTIALSSGANGAEDRPKPAHADTVTVIDLMRARCVFCHGPALMLAFSQRVLGTGGKVALDARLADHHAPDREAREAIVEFLSDPMGYSGQ